MVIVNAALQIAADSAAQKLEPGRLTTLTDHVLSARDDLETQVLMGPTQAKYLIRQALKQGWVRVKTRGPVNAVFHEKLKKGKQFLEVTTHVIDDVVTFVEKTCAA